MDFRGGDKVCEFVPPSGGRPFTEWRLVQKPSVEEPGWGSLPVGWEAVYEHNIDTSV